MTWLALSLLLLASAAQDAFAGKGCWDLCLGGPRSNIRNGRCEDTSSCGFTTDCSDCGGRGDGDCDWDWGAWECARQPYCRYQYKFGDFTFSTSCRLDGTTWTGSPSPYPTKFPTALPSKNPTLFPTKQPTQWPSNNPTRSPPTRSPSTSFPSRHPTRSPTRSKPTSSPTHFPSFSPTSSAPSSAPISSAPSTSPTSSAPSLSPSRTPSFAPTPSPRWENVCESGDLTVFGSYDNYIGQAALCARTCRGKIYGGSDQEPEKCIQQCATLADYTELCRTCMQFFIMEQDEQCRGQCAGSFYGSACVECSNNAVRQNFKTCTGFQAADISTGGGDGGENPPPEPAEVDGGLVSGIALGSLFAAAAVVVVARRVRDKRLENKELTAEMQLKIFGNNATGLSQDPEQQEPPKRGGLTVFRTSKNIKTEAAAHEQELGSPEAENPLFGHVKAEIEGSPTATVGAAGAAAAAKAVTEDVSGRTIRTRFSFHGTEQDELDVPAGASLTAIERNNDWWVCKTQEGVVGLIPASYVYQG